MDLGLAAHPEEEETTVQINLTLERETKNTVRFAEDESGQLPDHSGSPVVGTLYLQKAAHSRLGSPERITVTIEGRSEPSG
ncbi:MAG TPA: hypothetical protein VMW80_07225 [Candidatus Dormibacteraeota bacterium]|nr:hypothetical protein [Candidatus Dormibacteraeota bacterium]